MSIVLMKLTGLWRKLCGQVKTQGFLVAPPQLAINFGPRSQVSQTVYV